MDVGVLGLLDEVDVADLLAQVVLEAAAAGTTLAVEVDPQAAAVRLRRRRLRNLALASVTTLVVLVGSGAGYLVVNGVPGPLRALTGDAESRGTAGQEGG